MKKTFAIDCEMLDIVVANIWYQLIDTYIFALFFMDKIACASEGYLL